MTGLFDKKYVHFVWSDELAGKEVITAGGIDSLTAQVNREHISFDVVRENPDSEFPFYAIETHRIYRFVYYDPNYKVKKAYAEGKQIQYKAKDTGLWCDWNDNLCRCAFHEDVEYRIKPEAKNTTLNYIVQGKQSGSFETRAKMFKDLIEEAGKKLGVSLTAGYIQSCDDSENVLISDSLSDKEVCYDTLADTL